MGLFNVYFSPTGGTKRCASYVADGWNEEYINQDITLPMSKGHEFTEKDICIIAVPSFGGRVPATAIDRIKLFKGNGAMAVVMAVYGNRDYDDTLLELKNVLNECGFRCIAAISAVAEHSIMRQYAQGRPDSLDKEELVEFGHKIKVAVENSMVIDDIRVSGNMPYREYKGVPLKPKADKSCTKCGVCAKECPAEAIDKDEPNITDSKKCISCMRCIAVCPNGARQVNKLMLATASQALKKACADRKENRLFI